MARAVNQQISLGPDPQERPSRLAVVLNGNAKAVNERVIRDIQELLQIDGSKLYVSQSIDQAKFIARHIVKNEFDVVLCGGGDGTFCQAITDVLSLHPASPPAMGVLRLGTGNALATTLGSSHPDMAGLAADIRRAKQPQSRRDLPVLKVEDRLAPFAGTGMDSLILSDYNSVKGTLAGTPIEALGQGGPGYALAIATRSLWRFTTQPRTEVIIRNDGEPAWRMDLAGRPIGHPVPRGGVLYQGPVAIAAASTIPYYGLGLRLFPQALMRRDRFQLRVGNVGAFSVLSRLPALFKGTLDDSRIYDYFCTAVTIHTTEATPFQIGGDEIGQRTRVHIGLSRIETVVGDLIPASGAVHPAQRGRWHSAA
jgi:diacylglycerol kinase family enzyme